MERKFGMGFCKNMIPIAPKEGDFSLERLGVVDFYPEPSIRITFWAPFLSKRSVTAVLRLFSRTLASMAQESMATILPEMTFSSIKRSTIRWRRTWNVSFFVSRRKKENRSIDRGANQAEKPNVSASAGLFFNSKASLLREDNPRRFL